MADGTAVTASASREEPPGLARPVAAATNPDRRGNRAAEAQELRRRERATLPLALLASLAVHGGALAGVLMLSAQFAPEPLPVAGRVSIGIVASEGSVGAPSPTLQDVSADNRLAQEPSSGEAESPAIPQAVLATATAAPPIEALQLPEREVSVKPASVLESLAEITEAAVLPILPAIEPASGQPSPQALLLDSAEPKRMPDAAQTAPLPLQVSATPPLPARKPATRQRAQAATEKTAPSSVERLDEMPTANQQLAAAVPGHAQRQTGESASRRAAGAPDERTAAENDSGSAGGNGGTGSSPRFAGQGLSNPPPRYPHLARQRGQEGQVVIRVRVSADGNARSVTIRQSSGYPLLDDAAAKAIRRWRFVPASFAGVAMAGTVDVPVTFRLTEQ